MRTFTDADRSEFGAFLSPWPKAARGPKRARPKAPLASVRKHGTFWGYARGCGCGPCCDANLDAGRRHTARKRTARRAKRSEESVQRGFSDIRDPSPRPCDVDVACDGCGLRVRVTAARLRQILQCPVVLPRLCPACYAATVPTAVAA